MRGISTLLKVASEAQILDIQVIKKYFILNFPIIKNTLIYQLPIFLN